MLNIYVRTFDLSEKLLNTAISAGGSASRADLEKHLNNIVEKNKPNAGYNSEQGYWWIRQEQTIDRYTIE